MMHPGRRLPSPVDRARAVAFALAVALFIPGYAASVRAQALAPQPFLAPAVGDRLRGVATSEALKARLPPGASLSSIAVEARRVVVAVDLPGVGAARVLLERPASPGTAPGQWFARVVEPVGLAPALAASLLHLGEWLDGRLPDDPWTTGTSVSGTGESPGPVTRASAAPTWKKVVALSLAAAQIVALAVMLVAGLWRITGPVGRPRNP